jgi:hypothetical protein
LHNLIFCFLYSSYAKSLFNFLSYSRKSLQPHVPPNLKIRLIVHNLTNSIECKRKRRNMFINISFLKFSQQTMMFFTLNSTNCCFNILTAKCHKLPTQTNVVAHSNVVGISCRNFVKTSIRGVWSSKMQDKIVIFWCCLAALQN